MEIGMAFCEKCYNDVEYFVEEKTLTGKLKGKEYSYKGKVAYCCECNEVVYVDKINDYNLDKLYEIYRESNGIISLQRVREIPQKYNIGKRPLSNLLGWGELTFTRFFNGDVPTKQYSDILQKIYDDPKFYKQLLDDNKDALNEKAYDKSNEAVEELLYSDTKIELAAEYLISVCQDITHLALQKALYYVQGFYYAFYGQFMFIEECEAWRHGPVYKDMYFKYKNYSFDTNMSVLESKTILLSAEEKEILDSVAKFFCCYSGEVLRTFTHMESPWIQARGNLSAYENSNNIIEKEIIGDYFVNVKKEYKMIVPSDMKKYSMKMFVHNYCK